MKIKIASKALRVESEEKRHIKRKNGLHVLPHAFSYYITEECCEADRTKSSHSGMEHCEGSKKSAHLPLATMNYYTVAKATQF